MLAACGGPEPGPSPGQEGVQAPAFRPERWSRAFAGRPAPDLPLETRPDGTTTTLNEVRRRHPGRPMLVNLWATWCAPCLKELPTLDRLAADARGRLVVVPVSQDLAGWRAVNPVFTPERFPNLRTLVDSQMRLGAELAARGLPVTVLYDPQGREVWRYEGELDWSGPDARRLLGLER